MGFHLMKGYPVKTHCYVRKYGQTCALKPEYQAVLTCTAPFEHEPLGLVLLCKLHFNAINVGNIVVGCRVCYDLGNMSYFRFLIPPQHIEFELS